MFRDGCGVGQSDAQAAQRFRKAADQGNTDARYCLGFMYKEGCGVFRAIGMQLDGTKRRLSRGILTLSTSWAEHSRMVAVWYRATWRQLDGTERRLTEATLPLK